VTTDTTVNKMPQASRLIGILVNNLIIAYPPIDTNVGFTTVLK